ncbi:hypothetical protein GCM10018980_37960 [Streptomyces capoamus]|uniref:Uncharacterized protein n=1 Tax=Streptomyces capoamus TaxID=68183 RepID=A0A919C624_9ACTN|nr:hypothetical protein GCM10010501_66580 [Streptomyces libani subsp. rufus]GHG53730.1 hypothetical protein GCM10018980_37960 [Streptomyces capoamus]
MAAAAGDAEAATAPAPASSARTAPIAARRLPVVIPMPLPSLVVPDPGAGRRPWRRASRADDGPRKGRKRGVRGHAGGASRINGPAQYADWLGPVLGGR